MSKLHQDVIETQVLKEVVNKVRCGKCGFTWTPRVKNPVRCPRCQHAHGAKIRKKVAGARIVAQTPATCKTPAKGAVQNET